MVCRILALVLFVASLAFILGKVEWQPLANLLFAIASFAGGLITAKQEGLS
jgi:p-aminobenzoyl-glutamate transporter AbgT